MTTIKDAIENVVEFFKLIFIFADYASNFCVRTSQY